MKIKELPFGVIWDLCRYLDTNNHWKILITRKPGLETALEEPIRIVFMQPLLLVYVCRLSYSCYSLDLFLVTLYALVCPLKGHFVVLPHPIVMEADRWQRRYHLISSDIFLEAISCCSAWAILRILVTV